MLSFRPFMQNNKWMRNLKLLGIPEVSLKYVKEKKKKEKKERKKNWELEDFYTNSPNCPDLHIP